MNDDNAGFPASANSNPGWERATLEKLVFATIKEQQAARRWKMFMRLLWLAGSVLAAWSGVVQHRGRRQPSISTPHTAVIEIGAKLPPCRSQRRERAQFAGVGL
jgi:protease IV